MVLLGCLFNQLRYINLQNDNLCMGRKIVKGESSQNVKRLGPLTTAYLRVFQAKKKTLGLQASTAPLIHREMTAGMNYEIQQDVVTSKM